MVQRSGDAFEINSTTANEQDQPAVAGLDGGGFVAAWRDTSGWLTGGSDDIRMQVFDGEGAPIGSEIRANTTTDGAQDAPSVAGLEGGGFVVAWADSSVVSPDSNSISDITAQLFASDGTALSGEFRVNTTTEAFQLAPDFAPLADGGFLATWTDGSLGASGDFGRVTGQIFGPGGQKEGGEIVLNTTTKSAQSDPVVAGLSDGGFVAVWGDSSNTGKDTSNGALRGQAFNPDGSREGSEFLVNTTTFDEQDNPAVTGLNDGRFVVTWDSPADDAVFGQVFAGDGTKQGGEFVVADDTDFVQADPAVAARPNGGFVVAFQDGEGDRPSDEFGEITARAFQADGTPDTGDVPVNDPLGGYQTDPVMTALSDGDYAVVWVDDGQHGADASETAVRGQVLSGEPSNNDPQPQPQPQPDPTDFFDLAAVNQVTAMYLGFFGRAADSAGQSFWVNDYQQALSNGTAADVARDMAGQFQFSDEAQGLYPFLDPDAQSQSNERVDAFVENVYDNLFDRVPEQAGVAFWRGEVQDRLSSNEDIGDVIIDILAGANGQDVDALTNKIEVANAYTETVAADMFNSDLIRGVIGNVDHTEQSVAEALGELG
jgi:hypothetical protein